jgi:hypothetical protein
VPHPAGPGNKTTRLQAQKNKLAIAK